MRLGVFRIGLGLLVAVSASACGTSQETETAGIGRACNHDDDCERGQACILTAHDEAGGEVTTCQIPCRSSSDCPEDFVCRAGSVDAPANVCVKS